MSEREVPEADACEQMDLFVDYEIMQEEKRREEAEQVREKKIQSTVLDIKRKFGKNAILKGTALEDGATSPRAESEKSGGAPRHERKIRRYALLAPTMSPRATLRCPAMIGRRSFLPLQP